jgi:hypothetical protein
MTGKAARLSLVSLVVTVMVLAGSLEVADAFERSDARSFNLQRDLRVLRSRTLREPGSAAYDLKRLQQRLHRQQIEAPRDPRVPGLEIQSRHLRWQADRVARRGSDPRSAAVLGARHRRTDQQAALSGRRAPVPRHPDHGS